MEKWQKEMSELRQLELDLKIKGTSKFDDVPTSRTYQEKANKT